MPALELAEWARFQEDFGPLTVHERIDAIGQLIAYVVHASAGGNEPPERFALVWKKPWTDDAIGRWLEAMAN